jgi:hypothetical protein
VFKIFSNSLGWTSILTFSFSWTHIQKWMWVACQARIVTLSLLHSTGARILHIRKYKLYRELVPQPCTTGATDELPIVHIKRTSIHLENFHFHSLLYGCLTIRTKKTTRCIKYLYEACNSFHSNVTVTLSF